MPAKPNKGFWPTDQRVIEAARGTGMDDSDIVEASPHELFRRYTQWTFGDPQWGDVLRDVYKGCGGKIE